MSGLFSLPDLGYSRVEEYVEHPVGGDAGAALRTLQFVQVRHAPEQGGDEAGEADAHDLVDGEPAPHLHELSQGLVVEGLRIFAVYGGEDISCDGVALLGGGLGVGRNGLAVFLLVFI